MEKWPIGVFASVDAGLGVKLEVAHELGVPTIQLHAPARETRTQENADKFLARLEEHDLSKKDDASEHMRARADEKLDSLIAERQPLTQAKLNKMIVVGVPFVEILRISKDLDFGLIVMGTRGSSSLLEELLFGSTADKVLRGTHIPVLCVP